MNNKSLKITKPSDALLPAAFLIASLLGRATVALWLFICAFAVKLCALATSDGLRRTFAGQPSMRSVQGSAILALILQLPGALIAALLLRLAHFDISIYPLIVCGLFLNIEQVFYEYLFALGDNHGAALYRSITALLTLTGLLLCAPAMNTFDSFETVCLLIATGLSVPVGLAVCLALGGKTAPRMNPDALRTFPLSMLRVALYPALALAALRFLTPAASAAVPLFSGLVLYALCRSPFRRTPSESRTMNWALLIVILISAATAAFCHFILKNELSSQIVPVCLSLILAAACAFILYGNINLKGRREI